MQILTLLDPAPEASYIQSTATHSKSLIMAHTTGRPASQRGVAPPHGQKRLPTMYDLPSEFPEEPGLPDVGASPSRDEYHILQPQLLARSLSLTAYTRNQWFSGSDLNLYYDPSHPLWHKRPDWFLAVGVPRLYDGHDLRRSYVVWQEGTAPTVAVEFLSLGTEASDLGRFYTANDAIAPNEAAQQQSKDSTPDKLTVYEQFLQVPHYLVYSRHQQRLRYFQLVEGQYQEQTLNPQRPTVWLADLGVGLGLWKGKFEGASGLWLRWCDAQGQWLLTDTEQAQQRAARLAQRLRDIGIDPDTE